MKKTQRAWFSDSVVESEKDRTYYDLDPTIPQAHGDGPRVVIFDAYGNEHYRPPGFRRVGPNGAD